MSVEAIPLWLALFIQVGLGFAVFRANSRNHANQSFLLLSLVICLWLLSLQLAFNAHEAISAEFWIRTASAAGILIVNGFYILRLAILHRDGGWLPIFRQAIPLALPSAGVIALCYTKSFLRYAELRRNEAAPHEIVPQPVYGPLLPYFVAFLAGAALVSVILYVHAARRASGVPKVELQFVLIAAVAMIILTLGLGLILQPFLPRSIVVRFAPLRVVVFSVIIAYGIATRKIMEVGTFVRRAVSYLLLILYLTAIYLGAWWTTDWLLRGAPDHDIYSHLCATLAVVLSMTPARGVSKNFADKLFVNSRGLDFRETVNKAASILASVTTLSDLLDRFAATIREAVGADNVRILLLEKNRFTQKYVRRNERTAPIEFSADDPLIAYLQTHRGPVVRDELHRVRQTPETEAAMARLHELHLAVAIGIFGRENLSAVMVLGPRLSGRIYGSVEQNALQVLSGQLAVAIENAQLFTEVQNAKIYNETLLENLTTGVIAAGADRRITVFNNEAGQILELNPREVIDRPLDVLPASVRDVIEATLHSSHQENSELILRTEDRSTIVRASSSMFHAEDGAMLGALMVLTDITALKRLELQIRRSDRLASLGTLSAGMAHEIKNPLVSIKTFAQLLPERYQDSDFRDTFSNLIGHEIDRIDSLVNQLLRFARPAKPVLQPMHVHEVLEKSLTLVGHRLYQKEIKLTRSWDANVDTIRADADQLEQVFLNFFINAMDAMRREGELTVATEIQRVESWGDALEDGHNGEHEILRITVRDNGDGIRSEDLPHVFDPFFTTKDYGTGLGLSVVHGIIQEHGGQIEVESELSKGTAFHILLPLVRFEQEVAAA